MLHLASLPAVAVTLASACCAIPISGGQTGEPQSSESARPDKPDQQSAAPVDSRTVSKAEFAEIKAAFALLQTDPKAAADQAAVILARKPPLPDKLRAHTLWIQGSALSLAEKHTDALKVLAATEQLVRRLEDRKLLRRTLRYIAASAFECGRYAEGRDAAAEAILLSSQLEDTSAYVSILYNELALNEIQLGQTDAAIRNLRRAIDISRRAGDQKGRLKALLNLGQLLADNQLHDEAEKCFREVLEADPDTPQSFPMISAFAGLGDVSLAAGDLVKSRQYLDEALALCDQPHTDNLRAIVENSLGLWELTAGNLEAAKPHFRTAYELFEQLQNPAGMSEARRFLQRLESSENEVAIESEILAAENAGALRELLPRLYEMAEVLGKAERWQEASGYLSRAAEVESELASESLELRINRDLQEMDQEDLEHLRAQLDSRQAELNLWDAELDSREWWYFGLTFSVVGLLVLLGILVRLLLEKRSMFHALSDAHCALDEQRALQLTMERQLARQRKSQSLESMASGIAHDFNNLLTGIAGLAEVATHTESDAEKDELLQQITSTSIEASGLTGQLRQFLGQPTTEDVQCDAAQVLTSTARLLESLCRPRLLSIQTEDCGIRARIDATRLQQVLVNLVSNAAEATSTDGRIAVGITTTVCDQKFLDHCHSSGKVQPGQFRQIDVSDNGHGLTEEERTRIFDPYFSTRGVGRGLGLSSVAGIVRSVGGFICVDANPDGGTRFSVFLPAVLEETQADVPLPAAVPPPSAPSRRVLIVDDESLILDLQKLSLTQAGMRVTTASSAEQALQIAAAEDFEFDCIITDYSMPGHNGRWLARQLRTQAPDLPIILCSGFADESMEAGRDITRVLSSPTHKKTWSRPSPPARPQQKAPRPQLPCLPESLAPNAIGPERPSPAGVREQRQRHTLKHQVGLAAFVDDAHEAIPQNCQARVTAAGFLIQQNRRGSIPADSRIAR